MKQGWAVLETDGEVKEIGLYRDTLRWTWIGLPLQQGRKLVRIEFAIVDEEENDAGK